jgi:ABC-type transport system involved in cytochrome bd biosynthesis fused ATPase/permease subunit
LIAFEMAPDAAAPPMGIEMAGVNFAYPQCGKALDDIRLALPMGSRCLLIGANGTGKTTLLQLVAGKYMVKQVRSGRERQIPMRARSMHSHTRARVATNGHPQGLPPPCAHAIAST